MLAGKHFELTYYHPKDRSAVAGFLERIELFGPKSHDQIEDLLRWKYENNSFCVGTKLLVCRYRGSVVATCGYLSRWMYLDGTKSLSGWVIDVARDEKVCVSAEGKMMGFRMVQTFQRDAKKAVPSFIACSFLCKDLVETYSLFGWEDTGVLRHYMKVLQPRRVMRQKSFHDRFRKYLIQMQGLARSQAKEEPDLPGLQFKSVRRFDPAADLLWNVLMPKFSLVTTRDAEYLNWRYIDCPLRKYHCVVVEYRGHMVGYMVLKIEKKDDLRHGYIVDLFTDPSQKALLRQCVREAERMLRDLGADVSMTIFSHHRFQEALASRGFVRVDSADLVNAVIITPRYFKSKTLYQQILSKKDSWFITLGDTDGDTDEEAGYADTI